MSGEVIKLVTPAERAAAEQEAYEAAAWAEAVSMLERALAFVKGRKTGSIAICFAFDDGSYGNMIPTVGNKMGQLLGAALDMQHALLRSTNP